MTGRVLTTAGLLAALLAVSPAHGDVKEIWLGVQGATCPKCGFSLAKMLKDLPGVSSAKIIVKPQHMEVRLQTGAWVDPNQMLRLVRKSNLKAVPDDIRLTVTGTIQRRGDAHVLLLDQMKTPVQLNLVPHSSASDSATRLSDHAGQRVEVSGYWSPGATKALSVTALKLPAGPDAGRSE